MKPTEREVLEVFKLDFLEKFGREVTSAEIIDVSENEYTVRLEGSDGDNDFEVTTTIEFTEKEEKK